MVNFNKTTIGVAAAGMLWAASATAGVIAIDNNVPQALNNQSILVNYTGTAYLLVNSMVDPSKNPNSLVPAGSPNEYGLPVTGDVISENNGVWQYTDSASKYPSNLTFTIPTCATPDGIKQIGLPPYNPDALIQAVDNTPFCIMQAGSLTSPTVAAVIAAPDATAMAHLAAQIFTLTPNTGGTQMTLGNDACSYPSSTVLPTVVNSPWNQEGYDNLAIMTYGIYGSAYNPTVPSTTNPNYQACWAIPPQSNIPFIYRTISVGQSYVTTPGVVEEYNPLAILSANMQLNYVDPSNSNPYNVLDYSINDPLNLTGSGSPLLQVGNGVPPGHGCPGPMQSMSACSDGDKLYIANNVTDADLLQLAQDPNCVPYDAGQGKDSNRLVCTVTVTATVDSHFQDATTYPQYQQYAPSWVVYSQPMQFIINSDKVLKAKTVSELTTPLYTGIHYNSDTPNPLQVAVKLGEQPTQAGGVIFALPLNSYFNGAVSSTTYQLNAAQVMPTIDTDQPTLHPIAFIQGINQVTYLTSADGGQSASGDGASFVLGNGANGCPAQNLCATTLANVPGSYQINLKATSSDGTESAYQTFYINVGPNNPTFSQWQQGPGADLSQHANYNVMRPATGVYGTTYMYTETDPDKDLPGYLAAMGVIANVQPTGFEVPSDVSDCSTLNIAHGGKGPVYISRPSCANNAQNFTTYLAQLKGKAPVVVDLSSLSDSPSLSRTVRGDLNWINNTVPGTDGTPLINAGLLEMMSVDYRNGLMSWQFPPQQPSSFATGNSTAPDADLAKLIAQDCAINVPTSSENYTNNFCPVSLSRTIQSIDTWVPMTASLFTDGTPKTGLILNYSVGNNLANTVSTLNTLEANAMAEQMVWPALMPWNQTGAQNADGTWAWNTNSQQQISTNGLDGIAMDPEKGFDNADFSEVLKLTTDKLAYSGKSLSYFYFGSSFTPSMMNALGPLGAALFSTYDTSLRAPESAATAPATQAPSTVTVPNYTDTYNAGIASALYQIFNYYDYTCSDWGSFDAKTGKIWSSNGNKNASISWCTSSVIDATWGVIREVYDTFGSSLPSPASSIEMLNTNIMPTLPVAASATQSEALELWNPDFSIPYQVLGSEIVPAQQTFKVWQQGLAMTNFAPANMDLQTVPTQSCMKDGAPCLNPSDATGTLALTFDPTQSACAALTNANLDSASEQAMDACLFGAVPIAGTDSTFAVQTYKPCGSGIPLSQCIEIHPMEIPDGSGGYRLATQEDYINADSQVFLQDPALKARLAGFSAFALENFDAAPADCYDPPANAGSNIACSDPWYIGYDYSFPGQHYAPDFSNANSTAIWTAFGNVQAAILEGTTDNE